MPPEGLAPQRAMRVRTASSSGWQKHHPPESLARFAWFLRRREGTRNSTITHRLPTVGLPISAVAQVTGDLPLSLQASKIFSAYCFPVRVLRGGCQPTGESLRRAPRAAVHASGGTRSATSHASEDRESLRMAETSAARKPCAFRPTTRARKFQRTFAMEFNINGTVFILFTKRLEISFPEPIDCEPGIT